MPRNAQGEFSLVAGNPVVSGTPVSSTTHNSTMSDLAQGIRDSLDRNGRGGMLVPFKLPDGAVGAPAFAFTSEPATGMYRAGASDFRFAVVGVDVLKLTGAAVDVQKPLTVSGNTAWHAGNDGAASGLDADLLDGQHGSYFLDLANATGTLAAARMSGANIVTALGYTPWHAGNDGAASGLDADLLDGQHASAFALLAGATFTGGVAGTTFDTGTTLGAKFLAYDGGAGTRNGMGVEATGLTLFTNGTTTFHSGGEYNGLAVFSIGSGGEVNFLGNGWHKGGAAPNNGNRFYFDANTYVTSPSGYIYQGLAAGVYKAVLDPDGNFVAAGNITAYGAVSDERLKTNVRPVEGALSKVRSIRAVTHEWDEDALKVTGFSPTRGRVHGVIAQDVKKVMPDAVFDANGFDEKAGETYLGVRYERLTVLLLAAVQELTERLRASGVRV